MGDNTLYYGDNLDILRRYVADESVDLIYLDPPFNSNADYNVLFAEKDGTQAHAQIKAFEDTWTWDLEAAQEYAEVLRSGHDRVAKCLKGIHDFLGGSDMLAYLSMMARRLIELRRVLKPAGSIYLHCDPTASHYLKIVLDSIFGPENFRSEIIWRRTASHNSAKRFAPIHDVILFYAKSAEAKWKKPKRPYMRQHVKDNFIREGDRWKTAYYGNVLTGAGLRGGESGMEWRGVNPTAKGRHWAIPGELVQQVEEATGESFDGLKTLAKLEKLFQLGAITIREGMAWPEYALYIDPTRGQAASDLWAFQPYTNGLVFGTDEGIDEDVRWLNPKDKERLGYPTQKPVGLLERIICASSDPGDVILDPFCGCGASIAAAQRLERKWIGIDITHLAINLIKVRLADAFGRKLTEGHGYKVIGEPEDLESAKDLAAQDKYQFQYWALGLVGARPMEQKKGADKGIDGRLYITDAAGETREIIIQVKAGHVTASQVRDLRGVIEREGAAIGVFVCLEKPTKPMLAEAADAGVFQTAAVGRTSHPRLQILTIEDLLGGKRIDMPPQQEIRSFKQAPKAKGKKPLDAQLPFGGTNGG